MVNIAKNHKRAAPKDRLTGSFACSMAGTLEGDTLSGHGRIPHVSFILVCICADSRQPSSGYTCLHIITAHPHPLPNENDDSDVLEANQNVTTPMHITAWD